MAELDKTEFTFPDEVEDKKSRSKVEEAEPEVEVVDDTPEQDRGRKPMDEAPKDVTDEELSKYDEGVRKRIQHPGFPPRSVAVGCAAARPGQGARW